MRWNKFFFIAFAIINTTHIQCMMMDPQLNEKFERLITTVETITTLLENLSPQLAPATQKFGVGTLGFFSAGLGLLSIRQGVCKTINNDCSQLNSQSDQRTWWTPERQKGILLCTFGLAFLSSGGYTMLKPSKVIDYFCT